MSLCFRCELKQSAKGGVHIPDGAHLLFFFFFFFFFFPNFFFFPFSDAKLGCSEVAGHVSLCYGTPEKPKPTTLRALERNKKQAVRNGHPAFFSFIFLARSSCCRKFISYILSCGEILYGERINV